MALQVLPPLVDLIPEARLNLAIYQLRQQNVAAALKLLETMQPNAPYEYVLKAVVNAVYGQSLISNNRLAAAEHLKVAQQFFQLVGSSASECGLSRFQDVRWNISTSANQFRPMQTLFPAVNAWHRTSFWLDSSTTFFCTWTRSKVTSTVMTYSISISAKPNVLKIVLRKQKKLYCLSKTRTSQTTQFTFVG